MNRTTSTLAAASSVLLFALALPAATEAALFTRAAVVRFDAGCAVWEGIAVCWNMQTGSYAEAATVDGQPVAIAYAGTGGAQLATHSHANMLWYARGHHADYAPLGPLTVTVSPIDGTVNVNGDVRGCAINFTLHRAHQPDTTTNTAPVIWPHTPYASIAATTSEATPMYGHGHTCHTSPAPTSHATAATTVFTGATAADSDAALARVLDDLHQRTGITLPIPSKARP